MSRQMQQTVDQKPPHFISVPDTEVRRLSARLIEIDDNFTIDCTARSVRKRENVRRPAMVKIPRVQGAHSPVVDICDRNRSDVHPFRGENSMDNTKSFMTRKPKTAMLHPNSNFTRPDTDHAFLRVRDLEGRGEVLDEGPIGGNTPSVSESAIPESITSGPSRVKSPDSIARSTFAYSEQPPSRSIVSPDNVPSDSPTNVTSPSNSLVTNPVQK